MATAQNAFVRSHLLPDSTAKAHIRELLRSNGPSPDHLISTISELSRELMRYDHEIARIRAQLTDMESEREALQTHHDAYLSLLAPIRGVPSEILAEVFALCADCFRGKTPISRLAHESLFTASRVCGQWHDLVMGTPTLWATIELGPTPPNQHESVMKLLRCVLERSQTAPLCLEVWGDIHIPLLDLFVLHSERWKTATIRVSNLRHLFDMQRKFLLLETLVLQNWGMVDNMSTINVGETTPNLRHLGLSWELIPQMVIPLPRLDTIECIYFNPEQLPTALSLMSGPANFRLLLNFGSSIGDVILPPTTSNISAFSIEAMDSYFAPYCFAVLGALFAALTLPLLREFTLDHYPSLQRLHIADHRGHLLITNTLLSALIQTADSPSLIPHLRFLSCSSILEFDDNTYLDLVLSRLNDEVPFEVELRWLPKSCRELDPAVAGCLRGLCIEKKLVFLFEALKKR
ncbi:hypothetical protein K438DRAFT_1799401 [Mycena galopus ATCC 62051]|nr:hypothetical protein K438DRAFT_1799401 [Mycena galopus ATCC 62051]